MFADGTEAVAPSVEYDACILEQVAALQNTLALVDSTNVSEVQEAVNSVSQLIFNLSTAQLAANGNTNETSFNSVNLVDAIKDFSLSVAQQLENDTSVTITSDDGSMQLIAIRDSTNCTELNETNSYNFGVEISNVSLSAELPGSCSNAYGQAGGGAVSSVFLSAAELHNLGLQGFSIGDDQVVMFKIDGYESGTAFDDGQVLRFTFPKPTSELAPEPCRFLNTSGTEPIWSSSGCQTEETAFTITCICDHATSFAVLVAGDSSSRNGNASDSEKAAISVLSYVGVCISMVCFIVMLGLYGFFSGARQERNKKIFMNILLMLFLTMFLFLLGSVAGPSALGNNGCKTVAVFLQYFLLAAFAWMLAEGHLLLVGISNPFTAASLKSIRLYTLLAYGVPLVYVATIASVYWDDFGEQSTGVCYVSDRILPTVYIPIGAVGVFNVYVFYRVWQAIAAVPKSRRRSPLQTWRKKMKTDAFKSMSLFTLLGITWLVGLFFLTGDNVFWEIPFIVLNAFQGLFIFLTHCIYDRDLREEMWSYRQVQLGLKSRTSSRNQRFSSVSSRNSRSSKKLTARRQSPSQRAPNRPTYWGQKRSTVKDGEPNLATHSGEATTRQTSKTTTRRSSTAGNIFYRPDVLSLRNQEESSSTVV